MELVQIKQELAAAGRELIECQERVVLLRAKLREASIERDDMLSALSQVQSFLNIEFNPGTLQAVRTGARKQIQALVDDICKRKHY